MDRTVLVISFAFLIALIPFSNAGAHELSKDGRISAFLHVAPDDIPRPGKTNNLYFYFNDQDFRFSMEGCYCNATVKEGRKLLFKGGLASEDIRVGKLEVRLPDNNQTYAVTVDGAPKTAGFFQPFNLKFDLEVGNPPPEPAPPRRSWIYFPPAVLTAGILSALAYRRFKSSNIKG